MLVNNIYIREGAISVDVNICVCVFLFIHKKRCGKLYSEIVSGYHWVDIIRVVLEVTFP